MDFSGEVTILNLISMVCTFQLSGRVVELWEKRYTQVEKIIYTCCQIRSYVNVIIFAFTVFHHGVIIA
jgi:hypothetical protein